MTSDSERIAPGCVALGTLVATGLGAAELVHKVLAPNDPVHLGYSLEVLLLYAAGGALLATGPALFAGWRDYSRGVAAALCLAVVVAAVGGIQVRFLWGIREALLALLPLAAAGAALGFGLARGLPILLRPAASLGLVAGLLLGGVAALIPEQAERIEVVPAGRDRNVLLVIVDTLRRDHLSLYGYPRATSPELEALAETAVTFDKARSHSPWTKPATASILTSLYPSTHRVTNPTSALPTEADSLAEILRRAGYRTASFIGNPYVSPTFHFDQGFERVYTGTPSRFRQIAIGQAIASLAARLPPLAWVRRGLERLERSVTGEREMPKGGLRADELVEAMTPWLDQVKDERFFGYVHFMDPHRPYDPPEGYRGRFSMDAVHAAGPKEPAAMDGAETLADVIALYDEEIAFVDHWLGILLDRLEERGLLEETLVIVTSDHGEEFLDHGDYGHGNSLYFEQLDTPLVIRFPAADGDLARHRGTRVSHQVRHVDLMPTVLETLGLPVPGGLAGWSLVSAIEGDEPRDARPAFGECSNFHFDGRGLAIDGQYVIRARTPAGIHVEAYDRRNDPREQQDVSLEASWVEPSLERLDSFIEAAETGIGIPDSNVGIDEETSKALKALGYLEEE